MARRNKGTTHGTRSRDTLTARAVAQIKADRAVRIKAVLDAIGDMELADGHSLLLQTVVAMERQMDELGVAPHDTRQRVSGADFTPCRKCAYSVRDGEDDTGIVARCTAFSHADGVALLTCRTDGCSFGREKGE